MPNIYEITLRQRDTILNVVSDSMPNYQDRQYSGYLIPPFTERCIVFPTLYDTFGDTGNTKPGDCYNGGSGLADSAVFYLPEKSVAAIHCRGQISLSGTAPTNHFFSIYVRGRTPPITALGGPWTWSKVIYGGVKPETAVMLKDAAPIDPLPATTLTSYGNPTGLLPFPLPGGGAGYSTTDWTDTGTGLRIKKADILAIVPRYWAP